MRNLHYAKFPRRPLKVTQTTPKKRGPGNATIVAMMSHNVVSLQRRDIFSPKWLLQFCKISRTWCIFRKPMKWVQRCIVHMEISSTFHARDEYISGEQIRHWKQWGQNSTKLSLPLRHVDPHRIHPSLDQPHSPSQMACGSNQLFCHSTLFGHTDTYTQRQTDRWDRRQLNPISAYTLLINSALRSVHWSIYKGQASKYTILVTKHNRACEKNCTLLCISDNYVHCIMLSVMIPTGLLQLNSPTFFSKNIFPRTFSLTTQIPQLFPVFPDL